MARILIVEDDIHMLRVLAMWLGKNGHDIIEARDGKIAQELLAAQPAHVDLVLSDINMPRLSGLELARWIRDALGSAIPVILLSSRCDQSQLASRLPPVAITIHPKPFSPSRLVAQIESALQQSDSAASGTNGQEAMRP